MQWLWLFLLLLLVSYIFIPQGIRKQILRFGLGIFVPRKFLERVPAILNTSFSSSYQWNNQKCHEQQHEKQLGELIPDIWGRKLSYKTQNFWMIKSKSNPLTFKIAECLFLLSISWFIYYKYILRFLCCFSLVKDLLIINHQWDCFSVSIPGEISNSFVFWNFILTTNPLVVSVCTERKYFENCIVDINFSHLTHE